MTALNVRTMGGLCIEKNGKQLADKLGLKALALLCLLLTAPERNMRKNKAISMLWPDSDEDASRNNLRYNLWNIRKIIGDEAGGSLILADKSNLRINPAYPVSVDILYLKTFDADKAYTEEELKGYNACFRGEYLEGFYIKGCMEFSDLMLMERIACQNLQIQVLERLYCLYEQAGNHSRCMEILRELLLIDPYNERFACAMMRHMAGAGQYANTLTFYRKFTENIRKDLNLPPTLELKQLYQEISGGKYGKKQAAFAEAEADSQPLLAAVPGESGQTIEIQALCLAAVEYFFMAECLEQINVCMGSKLQEIVETNVLHDLSFLCPHLAQSAPCYVPQVRLIKGFHRLLAALSESNALRIVIKDWMELDSPSKNLVQLLERQPIEGVTVVSLK